MDMNLRQNNTALFEHNFLLLCGIHLVMWFDPDMDFLKVMLCLKESCQQHCPPYTHRKAGVKETYTSTHIRNCIIIHENNFSTRENIVWYAGN